MAMASFVTVKVDFLQYLVLLCPLNAIGIAMLGITLKSVVSKVAPKQALGSVFATIDVLQNAAQVTVPFYRTMLFSLTQPSNSQQIGDPDPTQWLVSSGIHWLVATLAFSFLLLKGSPCATMDDSTVGKEDNSASSVTSTSATKKVKSA